MSTAGLAQVINAAFYPRHGPMDRASVAHRASQPTSQLVSRDRLQNTLSRLGPMQDLHRIGHSSNTMFALWLAKRTHWRRRLCAP